MAIAGPGRHSELRRRGGLPVDRGSCVAARLDILRDVGD